MFLFSDSKRNFSESNFDISKFPINQIFFLYLNEFFEEIFGGTIVSELEAYIRSSSKILLNLTFYASALRRLGVSFVVGWLVSNNF